MRLFVGLSSVFVKVYYHSSFWHNSQVSSAEWLLLKSNPRVIPLNKGHIDYSTLLCRQNVMWYALRRMYQALKQLYDSITVLMVLLLTLLSLWPYNSVINISNSVTMTNNVIYPMCSSDIKIKMSVYIVIWMWWGFHPAPNVENVHL